MTSRVAAPTAVRAAGALVALEGLAGVVFVVALVVRALTGAPEPGKVFGEAAYFSVLTAGVIAVAVGLVLSKRWARTPVVVIQLLLLGVAWYAFGPSHQYLYGGLMAVYCLAPLVLLFTAPAKDWAMGIGEYADAGADD
ncbi:hypothetical protein GCM10022247_42670 [Allokutzneria multivorans]|uniref:Integral membrane protein n=1 Tax=Allokutzneria multivorans TaxID=1142134 RepID=A0ABP7SRC5_9PSEU